VFEALTARLQGVLKELGRRGTLRPADVDSALQEIRLALLEADVHYQVVKSLLERVRERALSEEVSQALNPSQQVLKVLHQELSRMLGEPAPLDLRGPKPRSILLVGLQGSGKTTTAAKLARWLRAKGDRPWLVAADPYRPAADVQLEMLGSEIDVPVFHEPGASAEELVKQGLEKARQGGAGVVIIDTAGRSQIDEDLMAELGRLKETVRPCEVLLVADAMTGQESVRIAQGFHRALGLTGLILAKMEGDARGGAAISMRAVTGVPIKFIGVGETRDALDTFDSGRLASRILGMGDVLGLIEKAQAGLDAQAAEAQAVKVLQGEFTLEDFAEQLAMVRNMGPLGKIMEMLPGGLMGNQPKVDSQMAERQLVRTQAILQSMTREERRRPEILNASRKRRIAAGSGTTVQEINQLIRQYRQMKRLFKRIGKRGLPAMGRRPL